MCFYFSAKNKLSDTVCLFAVLLFTLWETATAASLSITAITNTSAPTGATEKRRL